MCVGGGFLDISCRNQIKVRFGKAVSKISFLSFSDENPAY